GRLLYRDSGRRSAERDRPSYIHCDAVLGIAAGSNLRNRTVDNLHADHGTDHKHAWATSDCGPHELTNAICLAYVRLRSTRNSASPGARMAWPRQQDTGGAYTCVTHDSPGLWRGRFGWQRSDANRPWYS